jgi:hypothetical protein
VRAKPTCFPDVPLLKASTLVQLSGAVIENFGYLAVLLRFVVACICAAGPKKKPVSLRQRPN